jgi:GNAT superfamily N-acetyltransferase
MPAPDSRCGAVFAVPGADGQPRATGGCEHWYGDPESLDLTWGAARRFQLTARVGGPDVAGALDELLALWRAHLTGVPDTDEPDSAAVVVWPSRDIDGIQTLLRCGFAPRGVVAARDASRRLPSGSRLGPAPAPADVGVRRAGPDDVDAVVSLGLEVIRYDAHFGGVVERPSTATALRAEMATMLAEPEPWIWLAERNRRPVGVLIGERPPAQWIVPFIGVTPVAYNMLTFVAPADRGNGVAPALVQRFHDAADAAAVPVTLLHYEQTNPLSAPFWARQGYRPLWTSWEARPACTVR